MFDGPPCYAEISWTTGRICTAHKTANPSAYSILVLIKYSRIYGTLHRPAETPGGPPVVH